MGTMNRIRLSNGIPVVFPAIAAAVLSALTLLLPAGEAFAGTITSCAGCHGMPPVDAAYRNISTGQFVGSHDTHSWMNGAIPNCGKCHKLPSVYNHRNGNLDFVANINNSRLTARYRNVTSFPQSAVPTYDTCSNVNCHFETTTPQRGNLPLYLDGGMSIQQKCATCHSAPPADARHAKHGQYYGDVTTGCVKCHPDHAAKGGKAAFSHATSAGHRGLVIQFSAFPNDGGAFDGDVSYPLYLYNPNRTGSCTNLYCHSPGTKAGTYAPPNRAANWGASYGTSCIGCHRGDAESGSPMQTGSHGIHIGDGALSIIDCVKCHSATAGDSRTIADMANHVNRKVDVSFHASVGGTSGFYGGAASPVAKDVETAYGRCSNIYCHSDGTRTTAPFNNYTAIWGDAGFPAGCVGCHGSYAGSGRTLATNNHRKHIDATFNPGVGTSFGCVECHARTVSNNSTIANKLVHVNTYKDYSGVRAGRMSGGTCTTAYCHSSGQRNPAYRSVVQWSNTAATYGCSSCHGASAGGDSPAPPAGVFASQFGEPNYNNYSSADRNWYNSHSAKHVKSASDCRNCHINTTSDGVSIVSGTTLHANTQKNVSFDTVKAGNNNPSYNDQARTCTNVYCHSNGRKTGTVYANPRWGSSATLSCNFCHPIASLSGKHAVHVGGLIPTFYNFTANKPVGATYRFGCANCHPLDAATFHTNGSIDVALAFNTAGVGSLRARNNASTNNGLNAPGSGVAGTSGISVRCTAVYCHSNGYAAGKKFATTRDWYDTNPYTGDKCAECHGNSPNTTIVGSPAHYDAANWLGSGKPGGHIVGMHYNNIYGGANGLRTAGANNTSSHGLASDSTTFNCNICHNDTVTVAYNDKSVNCSTASCHDTGLRLKGDAAIASAVTHVNGQPDVKFAAVNIVSKAQLRNAPTGWTRTGTYKTAGSYDTADTSLSAATYTTATKTCASVSCHFGQSVKWSDTGGATTCQSCHTSL